MDPICIWDNASGERKIEFVGPFKRSDLKGRLLTTKVRHTEREPPKIHAICGARENAVW